MHAARAVLALCCVLLAGCRAPLPRTTWGALPRDLPAAPCAPLVVQASPRCGCSPRVPVARSVLLGAALSAAVVGYGIAAWDHGSGPWHFEDEGWFGQGTKYGGADKAGHAFAAHAITSGVYGIHRSWGCPRGDAALRGALTAMAVMTALELGDATSPEYGFSWSDMACNAAGCLFGWAHSASPRFGALLDFRWEWLPADLFGHAHADDPLTGYESSTYLLALNAGALVNAPKRVPLDLLDLQVGYQVRDIDEPDRDLRRQVVLGVGLNLANLLARLGQPRIGRLFEYYQPPGISLRLTIDLDE